MAVHMLVEVLETGKLVERTCLLVGWLGALWQQLLKWRLVVLPVHAYCRFDLWLLQGKVSYYENETSRGETDGLMDQNNKSSVTLFVSNQKLLQ